MPNTPIVNKAYKSGIQGLNLAYATATTITIAAGQVRDSTNVNDIVLASAATINTANTGLNGLDQGSMANNTFYAVYLIGDSTGYSTTGGIISTDTDSPLLPGGYDMSRRIGFLLTNGSAQILEFFQEGNGIDRWMWYGTLISELANGNATTFTDIDMATSVPSIATNVVLQVDLTPASAANQAKFRPNGSGSTNGLAQVSGDVGAVETKNQIIVPCDSSAIVEYLVSNGSDSVDVYVAGYLDTL